MSERPSLISSLNELGFCTQEQLDEIQAREVIYRGSLELNLLELRLITEEQLQEALAIASRIPSAPAGYLDVDPALTAQLAESQVPALAGFTVDGYLMVYVSSPLSAAHQNDIQKLVGLETKFFITSELRFTEALCFLGTVSPSTRILRILEELGARPVDAVITTNSPSTTLDSANTEEAKPIRTVVEAPPPEEAPELQPMSVKATALGKRTPSSIAETGPPPHDYEEITARGTDHEKLRPPPLASAPPRRIYALSEATQDLASAKTRDRAIDVLLHFSSQYFDYTAIFAIRATEARGLRSSGNGTSTDAVKTLTIPLDLPSAFRDARDSTAHRSARLRASGLEGGIARDLARPTGKDIFLLPIAVKKRTVLLLWGDKGSENVDIDQLGDLFAFTPLVSKSLEQILLTRKRTSLIAQPFETSAEGSSAQIAIPSPAPLPPKLQPEERSAPTKEKAESDAPPSELAPPETAPLPEDAAAPKRQSTILSLPLPLKDGRRPTQRNTAAPPASRSTPQKAFAPSPHQVAKAEKRALTRAKEDDGGGSSHPPSGFPSARPGTLRGFPEAKNKADIAEARAALSQDEFDQDADRTHLHSRRIVPLSGTESSLASSTQMDTGPALEAPPPPPPIEEEVIAPAPEPLIATKLEFRKAESPRTLLSRRAPVAEPAESGWEYLEEPPAKRKVETVLNQPDQPTTCEQLIQRLLEGDESVIEKLIDHGDTAVGALIAQFPGPVSEPSSPRTPASSCGPILKALVRLGQKSTPFLTVRTADEDPNVRRWATFLMGELPGRESALAIAGRLLDSAPEVRRAALASARRARADALTRRSLRAQIEGLCRDRKLAVESRCSAVEAIADIREHEAIPTLLQLLEENERSVARAVRWALSVLTRQDFGKDAAAWRNFWQEHRNQDRVEWLIKSLAHDNRDLRRAAADELKVIAGDHFGYNEDLPEAERLLAQERFQSWWILHSKSAPGS